jgi:hypothetical protein
MFNKIFIFKSFIINNFLLYYKFIDRDKITNKIKLSIQRPIKLHNIRFIDSVSLEFVAIVIRRPLSYNLFSERYLLAQKFCFIFKVPLALNVRSIELHIFFFVA